MNTRDNTNSKGKRNFVREARIRESGFLVRDS